MKRAAIGIRAHSGWAALVAVAGRAHAPEILDRRRVVLVNSAMRGAKQPYHFAARMNLNEAEAYLARCARAADRLAQHALEQVIEALRARGYKLAACGILLASGRPLPGLAQILAAHPLIHSAEGEFFRNAFCAPCRKLRIPVHAIRERELFERAAAGFRTPVGKLKKLLTEAGRSIGSPWTLDHKSAALLALLLLKPSARL